MSTAIPPNVSICVFLKVSALITQKFHRRVLFWDRTMSAVWSDLWDWQIWGERKTFNVQVQETFKKLTPSCLFTCLRPVTMTLWNGFQLMRHPTSWKLQQWELSDDCMNTSLVPTRMVSVCINFLFTFYFIFNWNRCSLRIRCFYQEKLLHKYEHIQYKCQQSQKIRIVHHLHMQCNGSTI